MPNRARKKEVVRTQKTQVEGKISTKRRTGGRGNKKTIYFE